MHRLWHSIPLSALNSLLFHISCYSQSNLKNRISLDTKAFGKWLLTLQIEEVGMLSPDEVRDIDQYIGPGILYCMMINDAGVGFSYNYLSFHFKKKYDNKIRMHSNS